MIGPLTAVSLSFPALSRIQNLNIAVSGMNTPPGPWQRGVPRKLGVNVRIISPSVFFVSKKSCGILNNPDVSVKLLRAQLATDFFIPKKVEKSPSLSVMSNVNTRSWFPETTAELTDLTFICGLSVNLFLLQPAIIHKATKIKTGRIEILFSNLHGIFVST